MLISGAVKALVRIRRRSNQDRCCEPNNREGSHPANDTLDENPFVDALRTLEKTNADSSADLAMSGRKGPALGRAVDDDEGGAELDAVAAARGDCDKLDTDGFHDLVAVGAQAEDDTSATNGEDPVHVVTHVLLARVDVAVAVGGVHGSKWAHGVGDIVGTVRERVDDGGEDLDVLEHLLGRCIVVFNVIVDALCHSVIVEHGVRIGLKLLLDVLRGGHLILLACRTLLEGGFGSFSRNFGFIIDHLCRREGSLRKSGDRKRDEKSRAESEVAADSGSGANVAFLRGSYHVVGAQLFFLALGALENHKDDVEAESKADEDREEKLGVAERDVGRVAKNRDPSEGIEKRTADARGHRREHPRDDDGSDALGEWERIRILVPKHAVGAAAHHGHADDAANARVGRGHGHLEVAREEKPAARGEDHAGHAPHEEAGVVLEADRVGDALADRLRDRGAESNGTQELEDARENHGLAAGDRLGPHAGRERVGDIVGADAERGGEGANGGDDKEPGVLVQALGRRGIGQEREGTEDHEATGC
mmetsp:Transcript_70690/g.159913  ORF Transcript_70690/g.159913 Transcript_70690/m.159913 type:complete len:536 (+) Transcript_70690:328-1935(+)